MHEEIVPNNIEINNQLLMPTRILPIAQFCELVVYTHKSVDITIDTITFFEDPTLNNAIQIFEDAVLIYTIKHGLNFASVTGNSIVALHAGFQGSNIHDATFNIIRSITIPMAYTIIAQHNNDHQPQPHPTIISTIAFCTIVEAIIGVVPKTYEFLKDHFSTDVKEEMTLSGENEYSDHIDI